jgi:nucleotide-binding universal stress UspA family protein
MEGVVLCGVDGSPGALNASRVAGELAQRLAQRLVLVHVAAPLPHLRRPLPYGSLAVAVDTMHEQAAAVLQRAAAACGVEDVEEVLEVGEAAEQIVELAAERKASLVVVGSRGRGAWTTALLGSVSGEVATRASCPVVVVPLTARRIASHCA